MLPWNYEFIQRLPVMSGSGGPDGAVCSLDCSRTGQKISQASLLVYFFWFGFSSGRTHNCAICEIIPELLFCSVEVH